jgi:hypothetical protein
MRLGLDFRTSIGAFLKECEISPELCEFKIKTVLLYAYYRFICVAKDQDYK